jgi:hypothetical protein
MTRIKSFRQVVGYILIAFGLMVITPPYPDFTDGALWIFYGEFTGTNSQFTQLLTSWDPRLWDWSVIQANPRPMMITMFLVYATGVLAIIVGSWMLKKSHDYYFNKVSRKMKQIIG